MAQLFRPRANLFLKYGVFGTLLLLIVLVGVIVWLNWSNWETEENVVVDQPVSFSHEHHVSGLGIDCRYCHETVDRTSYAGMPSTHTCMSCHSQIWTESEMLEPVRASYRREVPIKWNRVYDLPDYVYFNHSIHVNKGVACESCHGRIDQMPLVYQVPSLFMKWCLDCHREPERFVRPREFVFAFGYDLPDDVQLRVGRALVDEYDINVEQLTQCSICHQ